MGSPDPERDIAGLIEPVEPEWVVGTISVGVDESSGIIQVTTEELLPDEIEFEVDDDFTEDDIEELLDSDAAPARRRASRCASARPRRSPRLPRSWWRQVDRRVGSAVDRSAPRVTPAHAGTDRSDASGLSTTTARRVRLRRHARPRRPGMADCCEHGEHGGARTDALVEQRHLPGAACTHDGEHAPAIYKPEQGERPLWDFPGRPVEAGGRRATSCPSQLGFGLVPTDRGTRRTAPMGEGSVQAFVPAQFAEHYFTIRDTRRAPTRSCVACARSTWSPTRPTARAGTA